VRLPQRHPQRRDERATPAAITVPLNILVVDDSPADMALTDAHLRASDLIEATITGAPTFAEAVRLAQTAIFDVVVFDLNLPDVQGEERTERQMRSTVLPRHRADRHEVPGKSTTTTNVLVISHQLLLGQSLATVLRKGDAFSVVGIVADYETAERLAVRSHAHVIVLDLTAPQAWDLVRAVNRPAWMSSCRVVGLVAAIDDELHDAAISSGLVGLVALSEPLEGFLDALVCIARGGVLFSADDLYRAARKRLAKKPLPLLSERELDVLRLLVEGRSTATIADTLFVSVNAVRSHVSHILTKLGAHTKLEAVAVAIRTGLVEPMSAAA